MKERGILFNAPMVRAVLEGRKTQTRRVVKDIPPWTITEIVKCRMDGTDLWMPNGPAPCGSGMAAGRWRQCPYGQPGDRLWVREDFALSVIDPDGPSPEDDPENYDVIYRADPEQPSGGWTDNDGNEIPTPWQPSINMPHWASRILLEIVSVRVERLQDISEADCIAEGTRGGHGAIPGYAYNATPREHYRWLWDDLYGAGSWDANPWVWVIDFELVKP